MKNKGASMIMLLAFVLILLVAGYFVYRSLPVPGVTPDGSQNGKGNGGTTDPEITVNEPKSGQEISSPISISGQARGTWFFEAVFPVTLEDPDGNVIAQTQARAQGDWMTSDFVSFAASLDFQAGSRLDAVLVLAKDNPSGLPENAAEIRVPVVLLPANTAQKKVSLYYYDPSLDKDASGNVLCSRKGLAAVDREIPVSQTPIQDTINLLISGNLTATEIRQGITTEYPLAGLSLKGAALNNGILTLEFSDPNNLTGGGSCRAGILWFQIETTARQFSGVNEVRFLPETLFQP